MLSKSAPSYLAQDLLALELEKKRYESILSLASRHFRGEPLIVRTAVSLFVILMTLLGSFNGLKISSPTESLHLTFLCPYTMRQRNNKKGMAYDI
jgi:hypothetical protein